MACGEDGSLGGDRTEISEKMLDLEYGGMARFKNIFKNSVLATPPS